MRSSPIKNAAFELAAGILALSLVAGPALARELVDATGTKVVVPDQPRRIVTLMPSLGELAADVEASESQQRLVGVSEFTDYPPALKKLSSVGPYNKVNLERIASLKPDLVLASKAGNASDQIVRLRELGIPVVVVSAETFPEIEGSMRLVSQAMGKPGEGERMARQFAAGLERLRASARARAGKTPPRVVLEFQDDPLVVAGGGSFLQESLKLIGAENAFGELAAGYPRPSREQVLARDPDVIVVLAMGEDQRAFRGMAARWEEFPRLKAVREHRVLLVDSDALMRPSLRLLEGIALLERKVFP